MISDLPVEISTKIIIFLQTPKNLLCCNKRLHDIGKDQTVRGLWVLNQGNTFRKWLTIASKNHLLNTDLIVSMIRILDNLPLQEIHQAKLIQWCHYSRPKRLPNATARLKHAILSKNDKLLMEFAPFFSTFAGKKMKEASIELCKKVGFYKGIRVLECL